MTANTQMELCVAMMVETFQRYATKGEGVGVNSMLNRCEFKELLKNEFPHVAEHAENPGDLEKMMNSLDTNKNSQVDFVEFLHLVGAFAMMFNHAWESIQGGCQQKM
ncbi:protein S100-A11-like [Synchiropus picturatus]